MCIRDRFKEVAVVIQLAEQRFGDRLVAAFGNPGRAEVAAADMRRDHHVGGLAFEHRIDDAGIILLQPIGVQAAIAGLLQLRLRAEISPGGVVELQVAAAGVVEATDCLLYTSRCV